MTEDDDVPLDANEEAQFRRIISQLQEEDPSLGRSGRDRVRQLLGSRGPILSIVVLVGALAALPLALLSGLYPLGILGYLAATLVAVRLADVYLPRTWWRREPAAESVPTPEPSGTSRPKLGRGARGAILAGVALIAVVAMSPGTSTNRGADAPGADTPAAPAAPAAPDADSSTADDRFESPVTRREAQDGLAATGDATTP